MKHTSRPPPPSNTTAPQEPQLDPGSLQTHCPRLGGPVPLKYCLKPGQNIPCFRILDCWWQTIDIHAFLEAHVHPDEFEYTVQGAQPKSRLDQILDTLERLKNKPRT